MMEDLSAVPVRGGSDKDDDEDERVEDEDFLGCVEAPAEPESRLRTVAVSETELASRASARAFSRTAIHLL